MWLLRRFSSLRILAGATTTGAAAGLVLLYTASTGLGGLPGLLAPLWVTIATVGLVFPNAPAVAMSRHGEMAGSAAALLGAAQFGIGGAAAPVVGLLGTGKVAMALVVAVTMLAAAATTIAVVRRSDRPAPAEAPPALATAGR